jgi:hypothetical protein
LAVSKTSKTEYLTKTLTGQYVNWSLCDYERKYGVVTLPFSEAGELFTAQTYSAMSGRGNQRDIIPAHANRLRREMGDGKFTPTPASANCTEKHCEKLVVKPNGTFELTVSADNPLLLSDAGHRFHAVRTIIADYREKLKKAEGEDKESLQKLLDQALAMPVTVTVYFDGNPKVDFINLQQGRPVDAAHLMSMRIQQQLLSKPELKLAFAVAKLLQDQEGSPVKGYIRFDSRGVLPLPLTTLLSTGTSDLATSLVGLAKVGMRFPTEKQRAMFLADCVCEAFQTLSENESDAKDEVKALLDVGRLLTPLSEKGTKGSTTMLIGLGTMLAFRILELGRVESNDEDLEKLTVAALQTLDQAVAGNFSGSMKRKCIGEFAKEFLSDVPGERHEGLPINLLRTLSSSALGVAPLPKASKKKLPQVDEVVVEGEAPWDDSSNESSESDGKKEEAA